MPRHDFGYRLAQLGAAGVALGGAFDALVPRLLPAHEAFLGVAPGRAPRAAAALVVLLLHTLGTALIAVGVGALALLGAWRRTGDRRLAGVAVGMVLLAEGANAWAIARVGSRLFLGPLILALLVAGGAATARPAGRRSADGPRHGAS